VGKSEGIWRSLSEHVLNQVAIVAVSVSALVHGRISSMRLDLFLLEDAGTVTSLRVYLLDSNPLCFVPRFVCMLLTASSLLHLFPPARRASDLRATPILVSLLEPCLLLCHLPIC
jgi:hypothetical protein